MAIGKTGIWLVGARGGVATTVVAGLAELGPETRSTIGLVTESPALEGVDLIGFDLMVGGHEIRSGSLRDAATQLEAQRVLPPGCAERHGAWFDAVDDEIRPGVTVNSGGAIDALADTDHVVRCETPRDAVMLIASDLNQFRLLHDLDRVVVVLLGSTEPPSDTSAIPNRWDDLDSLLHDADRCPLRASSLYAISAAQSDAAFINFTPSLGASCSAINELFFRRGLPHAGSDGKTGETLLKSVLAPMFAARNLTVDSWVGHNLLGNRDGAVLADPEHKQAKLHSKQQLLEGLLGYAPQSHVSIEPIESLGDWKTAWDHVHFRGFLGVPMTLQFTWQGCDSALAAPLVIDLVRLIDLALRRGEAGAIEPLGAFFKSPLGDGSDALADQMRGLVAWAHDVPTS